MKTNKMMAVLSKTLVGVLFISGSLIAQDNDAEKETENVPVGERAVTRSERVKVKEARMKLMEKIQSGKLETSDEETDLTKEELEEVSSEVVNTDNFKKIKIKSSKELTPKLFVTTYYTTHEGAFHRPESVSIMGDSVRLEDGSYWNVCSSDRYKTLDWMTSDIIIITPNHSLFSSYDYLLINADTGASVRVNLAVGPIRNGYYTHWIVAIDRDHGEIYLEDGSIWKISSLDRSIMRKWLLSDTVIIGVNDGWFSGSNPNILINVCEDEHVMGTCLN